MHKHPPKEIVKQHMKRDLTIVEKISLTTQCAIEEILSDVTEEYPQALLVDIIDGITAGLYTALMSTPIKGISCELASRIVSNICTFHDNEHRNMQRAKESSPWN